MGTTGRDIDSICTADGTWAPYPTCEGDRRDLRDGCDGCPGPQGGARNRTAEAILNQNTVSDRRAPKTITGTGGRKNVPSFAGNINIGPLGDNGNKQKNSQQKNRFNQNNQELFSQNRQQSNNQFNQNRQQQKNRFNQNRQQPNNQFNQNRQKQPRRNPLFAEQFPASSSGSQGRQSSQSPVTQTQCEEQHRKPQ